MAEGDGNQGGGAGEPAEGRKSDMRPYGIFAEETLKVGDDLPESIKKHVVEDQEEVIILVRVGKVIAGDHKAAVLNLGKSRDLDGDYEAIADGARNKHKGVKSVMERTVTIG